MQCGPTWLTDGLPIPDPKGHGERAVEFLQFLKHPKSREDDRALIWDPWQLRIVRKVYGPCHDDGRRLCRVVYLQVGRGNRKTSLGAALALLHTFGPERVPSGQVISAAADRKQARIAFEEAAGIIATMPQLAGAAQIQDFKNRIVHPKSRAVYEAIAADAATQYGRTPIMALCDELWAHKKIDLWHAIRTGLTKVAGSLLSAIVTGKTKRFGPRRIPALNLAIPISIPFASLPVRPKSGRPIARRFVSSTLGFGKSTAFRRSSILKSMTKAPLRSILTRSQGNRAGSLSIFHRTAILP